MATLVAGLALPAAAHADDAVAGDPVPPNATSTWLAEIVAPTKVHVAAADSSRVAERVQATTQWGGSTQLLVRRSARTGGELWIDVTLNKRPNGHHGWIRADQARLSESPWRIEVRRSTRTLRVLKAGKVKTTIRVVVGKPGTPTPAGSFALVDKLHLKPATGFLGNWALPLTGYSNVLNAFE